MRGVNFLLSVKHAIFADRTIPPMTIRQMLSSYGKMTKTNSLRIFKVCPGWRIGCKLRIFGDRDRFRDRQGAQFGSPMLKKV